MLTTIIKTVLRIAVSTTLVFGAEVATEYWIDKKIEKKVAREMYFINKYGMTEEELLMKEKAEKTSETTTVES